MRAILLALFATIVCAHESSAATRAWNNTGSDFNSAGSWTGGVPASNDAAVFDTVRITNSNLPASLTIDRLKFSTAAAGTIQLAGANTDSGTSSIPNNQALVLANDSALGNGALINNGVNAVLQAGGGARTISNAIALSANTAFSGSENLTLSGVVSGSSALTKSGSSTLILSGANTLSGSAIIKGGTLSGAATAGSALGATTAITVNSSGSLLLGANNQINNSASLTLAGGSFAKSNFAEGSSGAVGLGALTLTAGGSQLDFGPGTAGVLSFASFTPGANILATDNWTGVANAVGNTPADRLIFDTSQPGNLASFSFDGYLPGATPFDLGNEFFE